MYVDVCWLCVHYDLLTFKDSKYLRNPNKPQYNKKTPNPKRTVTDSINESEMCSLSEEINADHNTHAFNTNL